MKKKTLCLAACVAAVFLLAGCSGDPAPAPAAEVEAAAHANAPWFPSEDQKAALLDFIAAAISEGTITEAAFVDDCVLFVAVPMDEPADHVLPDVLQEFLRSAGNAAAKVGKPTEKDFYVEFEWADGMHWQDIAMGGDLS